MKSVYEKTSLANYYTEIQYLNKQKIETKYLLSKSKNHKMLHSTIETKIDSLGNSDENLKKYIHGRISFIKNCTSNSYQDSLSDYNDVNKLNGLSNTIYQYEYNPKQLKLCVYKEIKNQPKELERSYSYSDKGFLEKEIEFDYNNPIINYRYFYRKRW